MPVEAKLRTRVVSVTSSVWVGPWRRTPEGRLLSHLGRVRKGVTLVARVASSSCRIQVLSTVRYLTLPTVVQQLHCRPIPVSRYFHVSPTIRKWVRTTVGGHVVV